MTSAEAYEAITKGGASDFARIVQICEQIGPYCLVGGLAVNCYVEPVYTLDADFVLVAAKQEQLSAVLLRSGFTIEEFPNSLNARAPASDLRIQFTRDSRYQDFLSRAEEKEVLGIAVRVAALDDLVRGKIWAFQDPQRRRTKRKKDELDLLRLAESYPDVKRLFPPELIDALKG